MKVKDLLKARSHSLTTIGPNETVHAALRKLVENNIGALPVCDAKGAVLGIVSERDLIRECFLRLDAVKRTPVREAMTREVVIGVPEDDLEYVASVMTQKGIRHLPIMVGANLEAMVSNRDIVEARLAESKSEVRYLNAYISGGYS